MPDDFTLSLQDATKILGKSERTIFRLIRHGRLSKSSITTERGRELRLSESEIKQLAANLSANGSIPHRQPDANGGSPDSTPFGLDLNEFFKRYESAVAQMGYWKGRVEAQENEIKMLTSGRQELAKEKEQLETQRIRLSQEKAQTEEEARKLAQALEQERSQAQLKAQELQEALEQQKKTLTQKEREYQKRLRQLQFFLLIGAGLFLAFVVSLPWLDSMLEWLRAIFS